MSESAEPENHIATWDLLDITLQNQAADYRARFGIVATEPTDPEAARNWRLARRLDELVPSLVNSVTSLAVSAEAAKLLGQLVPGDRAAYAVPGVLRYNVVQERLAIELATDAISRLYGAESRFMMLAMLIREHPLSLRSAAFVDRAARLYLSGFGPECVVMCRSALDAALCSVIDDERVEKVLGRRAPSRQGFMLNDRISAARRLGLLDEHGVKMAHDIRIWGRDAVHVSPGLAPKPERVLTTLILLLETILPPDIGDAAV